MTQEAESTPLVREARYTSSDLLISYTLCGDLCEQDFCFSGASHPSCVHPDIKHNGRGEPDRCDAWFVRGRRSTSRLCRPGTSNVRVHGLRIRNITARDFNGGRLDNIDIFYFAGGESGPYINDISAAGKNRLRQSIRDGAIYIGTCAGAMFAASVQVWDGYTMTRGQLGVFAGEAVGPAPNICGPDGGFCKCMIDIDTSHPIAQGLEESTEIYSYNSPFFRWPSHESVDIIATYQATGEPTIITAAYGMGRVLLTGVHPEWISDEPWDLMTKATMWCLRLLDTTE